MNYRLGETVGDYEIIGVLGAGGMGEAYPVRHLLTERVEAMKVMLPDTGSAHDPRSTIHDPEQARGLFYGVSPRLRRVPPATGASPR
jgi:serine/threonine protein kinase